MKNNSTWIVVHNNAYFFFLIYVPSVIPKLKMNYTWFFLYLSGQMVCEITLLYFDFYLFRFLLFCFIVDLLYIFVYMLHSRLIYCLIYFCFFPFFFTVSIPLGLLRNIFWVIDFYFIFFEAFLYWCWLNRMRTLKTKTKGQI